MLSPFLLSLEKCKKKQQLMATIKVALRKKRNSKGEYPLIIRITKDRKTSYYSVGQYINEKHWDIKNQKIKKSHPNSTRINHFLTKKLGEANDKLMELASNKSIFSAQQIVNEIKSTEKTTNFFDLAEIYLKHLEGTKQFTRLSADKPRIKHFRKFLKNRNISFQEITEILLKKYQTYLKNIVGNGDRSVMNNFIVIRTIFNLAIRENIVDRKHYPFGRNGIIIKFPQSVKIGLSRKEITALEEIVLEDEKEHHARNVWLISFYFAGMRISDVLRLKWADFKDGRLHYKMGKNSKVLSLKTPKKALEILMSYKSEQSQNSDFVFPELKKANLESDYDIRLKISNGNRRLNKYLKRVAKNLELDKTLTMHIARHSFGSISGDRIPIQMLQKLYRHSDITTTINYQKAFILKDADDALDAVLNS
jgi:integrase